MTRHTIKINSTKMMRPMIQPSIARDDTRGLHKSRSALLFVLGKLKWFYYSNSFKLVLREEQFQW
jgi:hypothetical protein